MSTLRVQPRSQRPGGLLYFLLALLTLVCAISISGGTAFAQATVSRHSGDQHFTQQARIGFKSGDDWETSLTTDRFGHIYAMYKHYDVPGGQTCTG